MAVLSRDVAVWIDWELSAAQINEHHRRVEKSLRFRHEQGRVPSEFAPPRRDRFFAAYDEPRAKKCRFPSSDGTVRRFEGSCRALSQGQAHGTFRFASRVWAFFSHAASTPRAAHCGDLLAVRRHRGGNLRFWGRRPSPFGPCSGGDPLKAQGPQRPRTVNSAPPRTRMRARPASRVAPAQPRRPKGPTEVPAQRSSETSPPDVAPASAIAPKVRVVRIRKAVDSPPIARLPLGRGEAPAAASPPPADSSGSRQTVDTTPAGNDVVAAAIRESCRRIGCQGRRCQFVAAEEETKDGSRCLSAQ